MRSQTVIGLMAGLKRPDQTRRQRGFCYQCQLFRINEVKSGLSLTLQPDG